MDAAGQVGQQEDGGAVRGRDVVLQPPVVQHGPGVERVQRAPAHEVLQHHHEQHLHHAPLLRQHALVVGGPEGLQHARRTSVVVGGRAGVT